MFIMTHASNHLVLTYIVSYLPPESSIKQIQFHSS